MDSENLNLCVTSEEKFDSLLASHGIWTLGESDMYALNQWRVRHLKYGHNSQ